VSTQHRDQLDLTTKLDRIEQRSKQNPQEVFNNVGHVIDKNLLRICFYSLNGKKAVGIDGVTKKQYEEGLEERLEDLLTRIRRGAYRPKAARIVEIPKTDGTKRPLAISCTEDKLVQDAVRRILERIYEPIFLDSSHGFRRRRGCDTALVALDKALGNWRDCGAVLEIDLRRYFNSISHENLIRILRSKITDERFIRLVINLLKTPTQTEDGPKMNERGSPQGSIASPWLANIYLHYVLDLWFEKINKEQYGGRAQMVRYVDDGVFVLPSLRDAENLRAQLAQRLAQFGIELHEGKTRLMRAGKREASWHAMTGRGRLPSFTFLGFIHVWGRARNRRTGHIFWRIKRQTDPQRFRKKVAEMREAIKKHRHDRMLLHRVSQIVRGYLNYFGINDNGWRCKRFKDEVLQILYRELNRRSQKRGVTWCKLKKALKRVDYPFNIHLKSLFFDWKNTHYQV